MQDTTSIMQSLGLLPQRIDATKIPLVSVAGSFPVEYSEEFKSYYKIIAKYDYENFYNKLYLWLEGRDYNLATDIVDYEAFASSMQDIIEDKEIAVRLLEVMVKWMTRLELFHYYSDMHADTIAMNAIDKQELTRRETLMCMLWQFMVAIMSPTTFARVFNKKHQELSSRFDLTLASNYMYLHENDKLSVTDPDTGEIINLDTLQSPVGLLYDLPVETKRDIISSLWNTYIDIEMVSTSNEFIINNQEEGGV